MIGQIFFAFSHTFFYHYLWIAVYVDRSKWIRTLIYQRFQYREKLGSPQIFSYDIFFTTSGSFESFSNIFGIIIGPPKYVSSFYFTFNNPLVFLRGLGMLSGCFQQFNGIIFNFGGKLYSCITFLLHFFVHLSQINEKALVKFGS
jgi:hypothetical protein